MKKNLLVVFVLVCCLFLCACGVDEKYTALLEQMDEGNYEGIKKELMTISPEFKADFDKLEKYDGLIALLEAENYEEAVADVENRMPVPEEPVYKEVAITMDNWQEYFEVRPYEWSEYNDFGELVRFKDGFGVYLLDAYLPLLKDEGVNVSFKVDKSCVVFKEWDHSTNSLVPDGKIREIDDVDGGFRFSYNDNYLVQEVVDYRDMMDTQTYKSTEHGNVVAVYINGHNNISGSHNYKSYHSKLEIIDVTGTLLLAE